MRYEEMIEVETAKERFMGNYDMFAKFLYQFAEGPMLDELETALKEGKTGEAFEVAHAMKGVAMNLSLKLLEQPICSVTETLRGGQLPDEAARRALKEAYMLTAEAVEELKREKKILF